jgi:hypothetical protein
MKGEIEKKYQFSKRAKINQKNKYRIWHEK